MNKQSNQVFKLSILALMTALCYIGFQFFRIDIPIGTSSTAIHFGNTFCVLAALILGGLPGGLAGAIGMGFADLTNPLYVSSFPQTFILKLCIGMITGLVAHRIKHLNHIENTKNLTQWTVLASAAGMFFNVIFDPLFSYFYKNWILGVPSPAAKIFAAWSAGTTFINAITSVIIASCLYIALRKSLKHTTLGKKMFK